MLKKSRSCCSSLVCPSLTKHFRKSFDRRRNETLISDTEGQLESFSRLSMTMSATSPMELFNPLQEFIHKHNVKVNSEDHFRNVIYDHVIDTIDNRIESQAGSVPNEHLHQYASNLFLETDLGSNPHPSEVIQSEKCVLEVRVHRAQNLAPKDVSGTSDPYCVMGLEPSDLFANLQSKKHVARYVTTVQMKNINPEWNECLEIPIKREQIENTYLHIQVWDHDDEESVTSAIGALKDVKGVRGVGRYVKEVAQTMSHRKDTRDDFMGYSSIPLKNIPLEGIDKWYTLRANGPLQRISGRLKIGLRVICPHMLMAESSHPGKSKSSIQINGRRLKNEISNEIIYGGMMTLIVNGRHSIYKDLISEDENSKLDGWDGQLQNVDETLLREFELQRKMNRLSCAIAKWEIYCIEHVQMPDGIQMKCMTSILKEVESRYEGKDKEIFRPLRPLAGPGEDPEIFTFEMLPRSFDNFLRHCHGKIENHRAVYPIKENDTIIRLGDLLICLKTLREMKVYLTAKLVDTTMFGSGDISKDISMSLRSSMSKMYKDLCLDHKVISANVANLDEDDPIVEYNVAGLVKLVDDIHTALMNGRQYYHLVFKKVLKIDYMAVVLGAIGTKLAEDMKDILYKVNNAINAVSDPVEEESSDQSTSMFQLYLSLRDFSEFMNQLLEGGKTNDKYSEMSMNQLTNGEEKVINHIDALKGFHEWFRPTILRWLQMSRGRTVLRLTAAVQLDKVQRMDDIVKHSSSAVDAIACLDSVVTFWLRIKWPDLMDGFLIATRIAEDISNGAELYADLVHDKLKAVGYFDDEGQFDVTEELCFALNNLEKVNMFLDSVLHNMKIDDLARKINEVDEGPTGEKLMASFQSLVRNANVGMRRKIMEVTSVVGKKMETDIKKYIQEFTQSILSVTPKHKDGTTLNGHDSDYDLNREEWQNLAEDAAGPLMQYLTTNIITLKEWLCDSNFQILLSVLWKVCLRSLQEIVLVKYKFQKPYLFSQAKYILQGHLTPFFNAEDEGMKLKDMFSVDEYIVVNAELKMRSASSQDLMRLYLAQMYEEQESLQSSSYGTLNVCAWYDTKAMEIKVDIISAENLVPRDINGLSDPFVQLTLMPRMMFPTHRQVQTLHKKKTLNPIFEGESFSFKVNREDAQQDGTMIAFTVLDHDVIGKNDLEGECFLPMCKLDGLQQQSSPGTKVQQTFNLPLTQPNMELSNQEPADKNEKDTTPSSSPKHTAKLVPFAILKLRTTFDRDASEFCRWRSMMENWTESDDGPTAPSFIKAILK
ncbi:protein unc-13 homolog D-like [Styela clava]